MAVARSVAMIILSLVHCFLLPLLHVEIVFGVLLLVWLVALHLPFYIGPVKQFFRVNLRLFSYPSF